MVVSDCFSGFTLEKVENSKVFGAQVYSFIHDKSGTKVTYIQNTDCNLGFSIAFRTPNMDETDANHILEHGILTSSEKYPSKDLFFEITNKTYHTNANAYTYPTFTMYPVMSQSEKQLKKLMDAYLSCMDAPSLLSNDKIYKREGLRYTLRNKKEEISIDGTVYNEDFGDLMNLYSNSKRNYLKEMFPDHFAGNSLGLLPYHIKEQSYEHILDVYKKYYCFDNALLILYGKMDILDILQFLDQEYLSKKERASQEKIISLPKPKGFVRKIVKSPA